ncbi:MAG: hypothetical protein HY302_11935 [Opitutae bacterium]|nr:hypothetical protein [Opitutae bacterium]
MEATQLTESQQQALIELIDDPTPTVRQALLEQFAKLGRPSVDFLQDQARSANRLLAARASWYLRELKFSDPVAEFRDFIRSLNYELETGALLLSRTVNPGLDIAGCCLLLDAMGARVRELIAAPATAREKCRALNRVMFHEYGFRGDTEHYTDPRNSYLDQVLERRKGLPITLAIVYLLVADRAGLKLEPVGMPGQFMIGCYEDAAPFFIDAFNQGLFLTAGEVCTQLRANHHTPQLADLAPTPVREVLCRCCRNLAAHCLAAHEPQRAQLFADFVAEFDATHERHARS